MNCSGIDVATGRLIALEFGEVIDHVRELSDPATNELLLAPGFVDIQVNGFAGVDFNDPDASLDRLALAVNTILRTGVTRFLPTVITGAPDDMLTCLSNVHAARAHLEYGEAIVGFHVEGPHIGAEDGPRGAHPLRWVRPPAFDEYRRWQDATENSIRLVTISPHWPEAQDYIARVVESGCAVSIGHTGAASEQIEAAVDAGATLSTHIGNGAHAVLRRHPNYIWDQLAEDRLSASFIVDGIHLGQAFLRTALRAKTVARTVLVTDASAPAGAAPGRYRLGEQDADLTPDGRVVLAGTEKLAGSALLMNKAVENAVTLGGLSLRDAIQTATVNPARIVKLEGRMKGLEAGERADIVAFRVNGTALELEHVWMSGRAITQ